VRRSESADGTAQVVPDPSRRSDGEVPPLVRLRRDEPDQDGS